MKILLTALTILFGLAYTTVQAQIQIAAGPSMKTYYGDIPSDLSVGADATIEWRPSMGIGLFGRGQIGGISGSRNENNVDYSFQSAITALTAGVNLYPVGLLNGNAFTKLQPFLNGQAGFMNYEVTEINQPASGIGQLISGSKLLLGLGGGLDINFSEAWGTRLAASYGIPGTDEIDGWAPNVASNVANDYFATFGVSLLFRPGKKARQDDTPAIPDLGEDDQSWEPRPSDDDDQDEDNEQYEDTPIDLPSETGNVDIQKPAAEPQDNSTPATDATEASSIQNDNPTETTTAATTAAVASSLPSPTTAAISNTPTSPETVTPEPVTEETAEETSVEEVEESSILEATVLNINGSTGNKKFYVIGASFQTLAKAQEFQFQMAEKGYATIITTDIAKTRYRISFGSFNDKQEAQRLANTLRADFNPDTWIIQNGQ